ncbi:hypothetical protein AMK59_6178, partial [Oryctes borbonicus]
EVLVTCQMHQSHHSITTSSSSSVNTTADDSGQPPPLPPKKKHIMAYMEMFGNCSQHRKFSVEFATMLQLLEADHEFSYGDERRQPLGESKELFGEPDNAHEYADAYSQNLPVLFFGFLLEPFA